MRLHWESNDKKSFVSVTGTVCEMKFGPASEYYREYCDSQVAAAKWFANIVEHIKKTRGLR